MFGKNQNENDEGLSWLVFIIWRFIISWCVWKIRNNSSNNLSIMSKSLFERIRLKLGWMLKMTKTELELMSDPDMYILFEKGVRGRPCHIFN